MIVAPPADVPRILVDLIGSQVPVGTDYGVEEDAILNKASNMQMMA